MPRFRLLPVAEGASDRAPSPSAGSDAPAPDLRETWWSRRRGAWALTVATVLVVLTLGEFAAGLLARKNEQDRRAGVTRMVGQYRASLESELNASLYLTNGLVAYLVTHDRLQPPEILSMLQVLYAQGRHVRNLAVAPGNHLSYVYPLAGNEQALGLYYPDDRHQWPAVELAMASGHPTLAGPLQLRQGGVGLVYRVPVFVGAKRDYWGLVSMVMDAGQVLQAAGVAPRAGDLALALRGRDGLGPSGQVFMGDPSLFRGDAVVATVNTPGGSWEIAARPLGGWTDPADWWVAQCLVWGGALVAGMVTWRLVAAGRRRLRTEHALRQSEQRSRSRQQMLDAILENSSVGISLVKDRRQIWCNPRLGEMFGYPMSAMVDVPTRQFYLDDDSYREMGRHAYEDFAAGLRHVVEQPMRQQDGRAVWMRMSGQAIDTTDGSAGSIWIFEDIDERKKAEADLLRRATVDALTGVMNRRSFLELAEDLVQRGLRERVPAALLMVDLDHFKRINDGFGHATGDAVLQAFGRVVRLGLRRDDAVGRLGGEEFAILLPGTSLQDAVLMAERLRQRAEAGSVRTPKGEVAYTVSVGVTAIEIPGDNAEAVLGRADEALYRAKAEGRNCVRSVMRRAPQRVA